MYLKSIEIQGFKSFPDQTLLTFSEGMTAVVGPNGSGKSNIADAIRWVLGEQSARTLRGGKMEDVIFGGTRKRGPMGFCQVDITVDNGDGAIPLEYNEVTVTRRYYRSGESEFYINRKAVRLKDVRELFMDTGLGQDGYSMIGQGRIDEILSVKSAERREIFEEAAGISKVRLRREESTRKLDRAEENLVRVRDIISELEGRVEPLRQQAEKARQFLLYRDQLREVEVAAAVDRLDKLEGLIRTACIDYDNAERMLSAKKSELENLYERGEQLAGQIREKDIALEQARADLEAVRSDGASAEAERAVALANLKNAEENLELRRREAEARTAHRDELEARLAGQKGELAALEEKLAEKEEALEALLEEIRAAASQNEDKEKQIGSLRAQLSELTEREHGKLAETMSANAAIQELESRGENLFWQQKDARDRMARQREALTAGEQAFAAAEEKRQEAQNALRGFEMMEGVRRSKAEKAREALDALVREYNAREDRLQLLQNMEKEYEGFSFAVKKIMQAGKSLNGIHGPLSALIQTGDDYAVAIETALGAAMQNIVTDDEASAKAAIGYLKAGKLGRATFLPITAVKPRWSSRKALDKERGFMGYGSDLVSCDGLYADILSSLLGTTAVVDNIDSAIAMGKKYKYAFRIVTLDGQLIQAGGAMTGGSTGKSTGVLSRANEMTRLERELKEISEKGQLAKADREKADRDLSALTYQMNTARDELRAAEEAVAARNAENKAIEATVEGIRGEIDRLELEKETIGQRRTELTERVQRLEAEAALLTTRREDLRRTLNQMTLGAEVDLRKAGELERRHSELRMETGSLQGERNSLRQAAEMLEGLLSAASGEAKDKQDAIERALQEIEDHKKRIDDHSGAVSLAAQRRAAAEGVIAKLTEDRMALEGKKAKGDREIQTKNNDIIAQERLRGSLEHKRNGLQEEEKSVIDRLWESYELTPGAAKETYKKPVDPKRAEKRIGELRAAIKGLGSVNLDAVAEYEEVSARYSFMCAQRDDLETAKRDLQEVIQRLTRGMEETFSEKFRQINESFSKTFEEIFGGGHAYLKLENEKDLLECGIEISVELPGKGTRAISLLSGGEKAFVAIALYFAIIKVSPTPFCVLDEIDAALDDVNVTRFTDYMRKLCKDTQFIVITHRRGTMEGCDILYGATMQEHGVTKLLKLDLAEVESKLNIQIS